MNKHQCHNELKKKKKKKKQKKIEKFTVTAFFSL